MYLITIVFQYWLMAGVLFVGLVAQYAWATEFTTEQDYLQDFPVVLSASRLAQPISETPSAMTVIDRKMIAASGARNVVELFRLVPGMYVGYANGHTPVVSYRGTTDGYARRMQVLIDGRTVYLPPYGQVHWSALPLDIGDIERIEVVRGPSAASHGSNSVQGVINIMTRPASAVHKSQVAVNRGSGGISDVSARLGNAGEKWDYRMTLASRADNGFDNHGANDVNNDDSSTKLLNIRTAYRPTGSDSINFQFGYGDTTALNGKSLVFAGDFDTLREAKTISNFQQITWLHTANENSDIQLSYYHIGQSIRDNRYTSPFPNPPLPGTPQYWIVDEIFLHRHEVELQYTLISSSANRVVWGAGMRYDSVNSPINLSTPVTWREYRVFAHDEWRMSPSNLLNTGAMVERNAMDQTRVSPRISYNHHLTARHTLRASLSLAYRNPEMMEELGDRRTTPGGLLFQEFKAAGGAKPERAISREVGYIGLLNDAGSTLDIRAYYDRLDNVIWIDPIMVPPSVILSSSFRNDLSATYRGLEGTLNHKLSERSKLTANYAHQLVRADPIGSLTIVSNDVYYYYIDKYSKTVPLNSASLLLAHEFSGGMRLGVGYYYQDKVNVLDRTEGQPIMRRLDLKLAKRFSSSHSGTAGEIALVSQNALDDNTYTEYRPSAFSKRRNYITATLEF